MVSIGGVQSIELTGALRQQPQSASLQGDSSVVSCGWSVWHCWLEQQEVSTMGVASIGSQQAPLASTMQQHSGIAAAVSRAMNRCVSPRR